jgi:hypothetical protein
MSTPVFVSLLDLAGQPISVNVNDVITGVLPMPITQLPAGVPAGVFIESADGVISAQGTVAAVTAAIQAAAGGSPGGLIFALIKMSDGSIAVQNAAAVAAGLSALNTGVGLCTVTINAPGYTPFTGAAPLVTPFDGSGDVSLKSPITNTSFPVAGFDPAGVPANVGFAFYLFPTP